MTALSTIITECRNELIDTGGSPRWTNAEFIEWANAFFRELAKLAPDEVSARVTLTLAQGAFQTLPNQYDALVELTTNAAGESIREVDYQSLKASLTWSNTVADADGPKEFARISGVEYAVYPAVDAGGASVTAVVIAPPSVTSVGDTIPVPDSLFPALVHYMIYRARSKDAEDTIMLSRAQDAYQKFRLLIGGTGGSETA